MDPHALRTLEFDKILARLARCTSFSAGQELALALTPSTEYREVVLRQRETAEARRLIAMKPRTGLGGAHDVRPRAAPAARRTPCTSCPWISARGRCPSATHG